MSSRNCPSPVRLSEYVTGRLALHEHETLEQHVDDCGTCQATIESLDAAAEPLFGQHGVPPQAPRDDDPSFRRLVAAAKAIGQKAEEDASPEMEKAARPNWLKPGAQLGNYVLGQPLGMGGMGQVYRAQHLHMKREVAVKILDPSQLNSTASRERFQREVEASARLTHPNIVAAYDAGVDQGQHFLAMQYVAGRNLSDVVKHDGALPLPIALDYLLQAARGLKYAHQVGVIHRDIKPANLLLDDSGVVKVLDMGLARIPLSSDAGQGGDLTTSRAMMGTAAFMAPEQARNPRAADHRADIYSLGCTLYYLLAARPPYDGETAMEVIFAHREQPIPKLRDALRDCPDRVEQLFQQMLAKDPDKRPASMSEVASELERLIADLAAPSAAFTTHRRRRTIAFVACGTAAVLIVALMAFSSFSARPSSEQSNTPVDDGFDNKNKTRDTVTITKTPTIALVSIAPGEFWMGANDDDLSAPADQTPRHKVKITRAFELGKFEVTRAQFRAVMSPVSDEQQPYADRDDDQLPVAGISWLAAVQFCNRLSERHGLTPFYEVNGEQVRLLGGDGFRLPTEAEWEYACRAGSQSRWHFGNDPSRLDQFEWHADNADGQLQPVGKLLPNAWGLHDMHGNVPEWCWDRYDPDYYQHSPLTDPPGSTKGDQRVFRGGAASNRIAETGSSQRQPLSLSYGVQTTQHDALILPVTPVGSHQVGLRVARSLP